MKVSLKRIITEDGLELVGLLYEPETESKEILVHIHGMAGNFYENKFIDFIAKTLTDNGISFFTFNNRGSECIKDFIKIENGEREIARIGSTYERFEDCILDIKAGIDFVEKNGFSRIHLSGHSLAGSKVAYYCSKTNDVRLSSVIFLSPADMVGLAKQDSNYERDIQMADKMISEGRGGELLPFEVWDNCCLTANTFINLSSDKSDVSIFNLYNPEDKLTTLSKINIPSITIMGRKDEALSVPIDNLMDRVKSAMVSSPKVETKILGDADHGYTNYEQELADIIRGWIEGLK